MARKRRKTAARDGQRVKDRYAGANRALHETRVELDHRRRRAVLDPRQARATEKTFDKNRYVTEPAKAPPQQVAGAALDRKPIKKAVDTKTRVRPTCKKRPDSKKPSGRGAGKSRDFVPWCK